ncbi:MAG: CoA pyrophosphatase [Candidatus Latescibacteria bacterium]|jgi:8-oxo-dGTP pyrophosphatase MutT (NUDIX family)|nr:CoA pyrophosphatase [Candidatus Latescibacterota bacterium]
MTTYTKLQAALAAHNPKIDPPPTNKKPAAVAAILNPLENDLQLLFIERAAHPKDPWSGHIAFPGGTIEPEDPDLKHTAERETREELNFDLTPAQYLGRLDDVTGATLPVTVACFVYAINRPAKLNPNDEVCDVFWTPFAYLADASRYQTLDLKGWKPLHTVPAIDLLGPNRPVLWGLTYRLVTQLAEFGGINLPKMT